MGTIPGETKEILGAIRSLKYIHLVCHDQEVTGRRE